MTHKDIIKLNLGCGPTGIDGWLNYDWGMLPILSKLPQLRDLLIRSKMLSDNYNVNWPQIKLVDIRKGLPLNDNSVDYIYCSHVLEHFEKYESLNLLNECRRVLKKGGIMRVVLPDLRKMVKKYKNADEFCESFFGYDKSKKSWAKYFIRGHQWMYDEISFKKMINKIFKNVAITKYLSGNFPDLKQIELKIHSDHSLYIEAIK